MAELGPIAFIRWIDTAMTGSRWEDREEALSRMVASHVKPIVSAGFIVYQDKELVILAASVHEEMDDVAQCVSIPRRSMVSMDIWAPWNPAREDEP